MSPSLRWLPSVNECLEARPAALDELAMGERIERAALERALAEMRARLREADATTGDRDGVRETVLAAWVEQARRLGKPALEPVVNATGVIVHTNLGRSPLAEPALEAAAQAGGSYTPLEYDLARGERGSRYLHAAALLRLLTGAEDALVVNNNAAALLLCVDEVAGGGAIALSRGELIEIGGGFRIHEILARGRAGLIEVGATNKTRRSDYEAAIDAGAAATLKVHRSNFSQTGFVEEVGLADLCRLGEERGVPVVFDQGTGILEPISVAPGEPSLRQAVEAGAALVCASGDKLLGGPQAGLVVGRAEWVARLRANPLLRALRVDKMTLAALEATLRLWLSAPEEVPVREMLERTPDDLRARAESLRERLPASCQGRCTVAPHVGRSGGGTLPAVELAGWALRVDPAPDTATALDAALRTATPAIVARVADEAVWIDPRAFLEGDAERVADRLAMLLGRLDATTS